MRFVVTGCSQSGTGYVAQLLMNAGLPCGHEAVFNRWNPGYATRPRLDTTAAKALKGDSSYAAAPFLKETPTGWAIVHLVRPPLDVISSVVGRRQLDHPRRWKWALFVDHHADILAEPPGSWRAAAYWVRWNQLVEPRAHLRWNVEAITLDDLQALADLTNLTLDRDKGADALANTPRTIGAQPDMRAPVTLAHLGRWAEPVVNLAAAYDLPITTPMNGEPQ